MIVYLLRQNFVLPQVEMEEVDTDLQQEYMRQREYLERNLAALKKRVVKDQKIHQAAYTHIMQVTSLSFCYREEVAQKRPQSPYCH